ncbi:MAG: hypothetical protein DRH04_00105 [Deltaproteobacteria bacterium]|nr:MAG: hypothetical protein DRH04_00105 [Deltaproteobacteria bacterium]
MENISVPGGKNRHSLSFFLAPFVAIILFAVFFNLASPSPALGEEKLLIKGTDGTTVVKMENDGSLQCKKLKGLQADGSLAKIGSYVSVSDQYGETLLLGGAYNRLNFLTYEGGSVDCSPGPSASNIESLFDAKGNWIKWENPGGDIVITINLPEPWSYMREFIIQFVSEFYPTSFKIEYFDEDDSSWHTFDDVTNWDSNLYAKKTGGDLYNTSKLKITMREYNRENYVHIDEIIWTSYGLPMHNAYVHRGGGQNVYGGLNLATESGNVGIGTTTPSHPLEMGSGAYVSIGGTWVNASSREYKDDIHDLSVEEAFCALDGLNPVKFNYKAEPTEKHVGFIAEDVPDLVATSDRKGVSTLDIVAVLTRVVQDQQEQISELSKRIAELERKLE